MSSKTQHLRLTLTGVSSEDKNILFETWRTQMSGEDGTSNMQIIDAAIAEDRERLSALEAKEDAVTEVNGRTGKVSLDADAVNARSSDWVPTIDDIDGLKEAISNGGNVKTVNQIKADESGNITLNAKNIGALSINKEGEVYGSPVPVNADTLGGVPAARYALKEDVSSGGADTAANGIPAGGSAGQVLAKASGDDYDVRWVDQQGSTLPESIDADTLDGKTFAQLKAAILAEVVYQ